MSNVWEDVQSEWEDAKMPGEQLGKRGEATAMTKSAMEIRERRPWRRTCLLLGTEDQRWLHQTRRPVDQYTCLSRECRTDHQAPAKAVTTANLGGTAALETEGRNELTNSSRCCKSHTIASTLRPSARGDQSRMAT